MAIKRKISLNLSHNMTNAILSIGIPIHEPGFEIFESFEGLKPMNYRTVIVDVEEYGKELRNRFDKLYKDYMFRDRIAINYKKMHAFLTKFLLEGDKTVIMLMGKQENIYTTNNYTLFPDFIENDYGYQNIVLNRTISLFDENPRATFVFRTKSDYFPVLFRMLPDFKPRVRVCNIKDGLKIETLMTNMDNQELGFIIETDIGSRIVCLPRLNEIKQNLGNILKLI